MNYVRAVSEAVYELYTSTRRTGKTGKIRSISCVKEIVSISCVKKIRPDPRNRTQSEVGDLGH